MSDIECEQCRVNKYCGTCISCEQAKEMYEQGRADILDKLKEYVESRLDMRFALDILCKEVIDEFIAEQLEHDAKVRADAIDEIADYIKKHFRIGVNTIDEVVKEFKEQKNGNEIP